MTYKIQCDSTNKKSILNLLKEAGVFLSTTCHEKGICGNCKVRIVQGTLPPSSADQQYFTEHELSQGYRLACQSIPAAPLTVEYSLPEAPIVSGIKSSKTVYSYSNSYHLLIDIGTTTIVYVLMNDSFQAVATHMFTNPQIPYGTDIVSRIQAACNGHLSKLKQLVLTSLEVEYSKFEKQFLCQSGQSALTIKQCLIGGNTTMIHLLLGYPCESMRLSPFTPYKTESLQLSYHECPIWILPCPNAFWGGDILAGTYYCKSLTPEAFASLLIDLGTNGEFSLIYHDKIYAASIAAGPAFEGGNLSCGCASIPGAITKVELLPIMPSCQTIQNKLPVGICGTGAISMTAQLVEKNYVTPDGIILDCFSEDGILLSRTSNNHPIRFTRDDLHEVQAAIAAVKSALFLLLRQAEITSNDIDTIFLAGNFGSTLSLHDCATIGLFPKEWIAKTSVIGNSCIHGLSLLASDTQQQTPAQFLNALHSFSHSITYVSLAEQNDFQQIYTNALSFRPLDM